PLPVGISSTESASIGAKGGRNLRPPARVRSRPGNAGRSGEPAKGPDQKQDRNRNAEQPQKKITAHWVTSPIEQYFEVMRFPQKSSVAEISKTNAGLQAAFEPIPNNHVQDRSLKASARAMSKRTGLLSALRATRLPRAPPSLLLHAPAGLPPAQTCARRAA